MAFLVEHTWGDINGERITLTTWVNAEADAQTLLEKIDAASNAVLIEAHISTPIPLQALTNNDAVAANNESAATKAVVTFRGADAGSLAKPFDEVTIGIPAPIGSLINGLSGDVTNADLVALAGLIVSEHGVTMSSVSKLKYKRG